MTKCVYRSLIWKAKKSRPIEWFSWRLPGKLSWYPGQHSARVQVGCVVRPMGVRALRRVAAACTLTQFYGVWRNHTGIDLKARFEERYSGPSPNGPNELPAQGVDTEVCGTVGIQQDWQDKICHSSNQLTSIVSRPSRHDHAVGPDLGSACADRSHACGWRPCLGSMTTSPKLRAVVLQAPKVQVMLTPLGSAESPKAREQAVPGPESGQEPKVGDPQHPLPAAAAMPSGTAQPAFPSVHGRMHTLVS